ncbi:hypothetical protein SLA2020_315270 [Shorea laevis]
MPFCNSRQLKQHPLTPIFFSASDILRKRPRTRAEQPCPGSLRLIRVDLHLRSTTNEENAGVRVVLHASLRRRTRKGHKRSNGKLA